MNLTLFMQVLPKAGLGWLGFCGNNYHCGGGGAAGAFYKPKK